MSRYHQTVRAAWALVALVTLVALAAPGARAKLVALQWDQQGAFQHRFEIAPAKFAEVCGKLGRGQRVAWRFEASAPTQFNIHYHVGEKVVFPVQREGVASARGRLKAAIDQDYCWMWTNKGDAPISVQVQLNRP